jgi:hypothetical protein
MTEPFFPLTAISVTQRVQALERFIIIYLVLVDKVLLGQRSNGDHSQEFHPWIRMTCLKIAHFLRLHIIP